VAKEKPKLTTGDRRKYRWKRTHVVRSASDRSPTININKKFPYKQDPDAIPTLHLVGYSWWDTNQS
jgi:hypothetical protein